MLTTRDFQSLFDNIGGNAHPYAIHHDCVSIPLLTCRPIQLGQTAEALALRPSVYIPSYAWASRFFGTPCHNRVLSIYCTFYPAYGSYKVDIYGYSEELGGNSEIDLYSLLWSFPSRVRTVEPELQISITHLENQTKLSLIGTLIRCW